MVRTLNILNLNNCLLCYPTWYLRERKRGKQALAAKTFHYINKLFKNINIRITHLYNSYAFEELCVCLPIGDTAGWNLQSTNFFLEDFVAHLLETDLKYEDVDQWNLFLTKTEDLSTNKASSVMCICTTNYKWSHPRIAYVTCCISIRQTGSRWCKSIKSLYMV